MKWIALTPLLALPALSQELPPMPTDPTLPVEPPLIEMIRSPKHAAFLASGGSKMTKTGTTTAPTPAVSFHPMITFAWDYDWSPYPPPTQTNIVFEVYHTQTLTNGQGIITRYDQIPNGFTLLSTVSTQSVTVPIVPPSDFFIVRALDRVTGLYSNWNQVSK